MRRDEDWFDAVGKDDWRVEQIEKKEKALQLDTAKTMTHCKYCGKKYAFDGTGTTCNCGVTPLNKFDYHQIVERLDKIETLLKGKDETNN